MIVKCVNKESSLLVKTLSSERKAEKHEERVREPEALELEELRVIKEMVSVILERLGHLAKEVVNAIMSSLDGKRLGEEIAEFYSNLKDAGLPDQVVEEMVKDFYRRKLELVPSLNELVKVLSTAMSEYMKPPKIEVKKEKEE